MSSIMQRKAIVQKILGSYRMRLFYMSGYSVILLVSFLCGCYPVPWSPAISATLHGKDYRSHATAECRHTIDSIVS
jgi:hypothetical protein